MWSLVSVSCFDALVSQFSRRKRQLTLVNSVITPRYARLNTWFPKIGPISHPAASMPKVLSPISIIGSKPPSCSDSTASYPLLIMYESP